MSEMYNEIKKSLEEIKDLTSIMMEQLKQNDLAPIKFDSSEISFRN